LRFQALISNSIDIFQKNLIAKTWESLKNDNISDLVSNIEKSIHDKSKEKVRVTYNSVNGYEHVFCTD